MKSRKKSLRKWRDVQILEEIQALTIHSAKTSQLKNPSLYGAAVRRFGSWKNAIKAAGIDYEKTLSRKPAGYWNKDRIISKIKNLPFKESNYAREYHPALYSAALRLFTSWKEAVIESGFDYEKIKRQQFKI